MSFASEAAVNAALKYKPQREALEDLQRAAGEQFQSSVQTGKSEGILGQQAAEKAAPEISGIYSHAATEGARGRALIAPLLEALSPSSPFRLAAGNEAAAGNERLQSAQAHAEADNRTQRVAASELPAFSRQAALRMLVHELAKIQSKGQGVLGSEQATVQSEVDKAKREASKEAAATRREASKESAATRREERKDALSRELHETPSGDAKLAHEGKGAKGELLGKKEQDAAGSTASQIRQWIGEHGKGLTRAELVKELGSEKPERTLKNGTKVPKRVAYKPNAVMAAAIDWSEHGHMTANTEARLRREGYDPAQIGVPRMPARAHGKLGKALEGVPKALEGAF